MYQLIYTFLGVTLCNTFFSRYRIRYYHREPPLHNVLQRHRILSDLFPFTVHEIKTAVGRLQPRMEHR